jgi:hypothetical protein
VEYYSRRNFVVMESFSVVKLVKLGKIWCPGHMEMVGMRAKYLQRKTFDRHSTVRGRKTGNNIKPEAVLFLCYSASV